MKTSHHIYAILGLGIILAGASVANPASKAARAPTQQVIVSNTNASPVPVSVLGTPSVTGTVNIGNPGGSPVPVRDMDEHARVPVNFEHQFEMGDGDPGSTGGFIYTVPDGQNLVIETVIMQSVIMPIGERLNALGFDAELQYPLEVHDNGLDGGGRYHFVATFSGKIRIPSGTAISLFAGRDDGQGVCNVDAVFSGYLEPQ